MKILVIGKGGREHVLVWKIAQSPRVTQLFAAPGNPGIAQQATCINISEDNPEALLAFAKQKQIDLTVVGPESPLDKGIVDKFKKEGLEIFGPTQAAAKIESDKSFALDLMHRYGIPTGKYRTFTEADAARICLQEWEFPAVLKASGLAAGKGAIVCKTLEEALQTVEKVLVNRAFGKAGEKLVIMEFLEGEEASIFGVTDGKKIRYLSSSQDHKKIGDGDTGPNTGGMGAYAPAPLVTPKQQKEIHEQIMKPTIRALAMEGRPYCGILYGGLIFTDRGPKVIEFNCRLGDPEAQVVLPLLKTDIVDIFTAVCNGTLEEITIETDHQAATCVVMVSKGYPNEYQTGYPISGVEKAESLEDLVVFHASTEKNNGQLVTGGGRVLGVTAVGKDIPSSMNLVYKAVNQIQFQDSYYRKDIGHRAIK